MQNLWRKLNLKKCKSTRYSRCIVILEFLQFDFFRKGLERPDFINRIREIIEKDWEKSENYENDLRNYLN